MNNQDKLLNVSVIYALADEQHIFTLSVAPGASVADVINQSTILDTYPEIDLTKNKIGIYGRITTLNSLVQGNDRIEIYRPLIADPKEIRRQRAAKL